MKADGQSRPWARAARIAAVCVLTLVTATALAAQVTGRVRLPNAPPQEDTPNTFYWKAWNGFVASPAARLDARREVSVVLTGAGPDEPIGCTYRLSGGDFLPRTLVVKSGSTLRIENQDGCSHELQSEDLPDFSPLATNPGNARPVAVPTGGPYTVTDRLYGHVRGVVVPVDDLVACATVNPNGSFSFSSVPAGEYTLKVFREGEAIHEAPVTISDRELTLDPIAVER